MRNNAPFQYEQKNKSKPGNIYEFKGVCLEICNNIEANTGMVLQYMPYNNTKEIVIALENNEIDMAAGIENLDTYSDRVLYSKDFIEYMVVLLKNETVDFERFENAKQAVIKGEISPVSELDSENQLEKENAYAMLNSINMMDSVYGVLNYYSADYYIREGNLSHIVMVPLTQKVKMSFGYSNNVDTRLISICNKCLYSIITDNIQFLLTEQMDSVERRVTLKNYLEANPFQSILLCIAVVAIVMFIVVIFQNERAKSAREHAVDVKRYETLSRLMDEYVFEYDFETDTIHFDAKFNTKFNFGGDIKIAKYGYGNRTLNKILSLCENAKTKEYTYTEPFKIEDKEGIVNWYRMTIYRIVQNGISTQHLIGKLINVQKEMEEQIRIKEKAETDVLTGLNNIVGFENSFNKLKENWHEGESVAFGIIDFDDFKSINDNLGHAGGDEALILLAEKMNKLSASKENIITARYGGDEFFMCAFGLSSEEARDLFRTLVEEMDIDLTYQLQCQHISISLGAVYATKKIPYSVLFKEADKVLYKVKAIGKNSYKMINHMDDI